MCFSFYSPLSNHPAPKLRARASRDVEHVEPADEYILGDVEASQEANRQFGILICRPRCNVHSAGKWEVDGAEHHTGSVKCQVVSGDFRAICADRAEEGDRRVVRGESRDVLKRPT